MHLQRIVLPSGHGTWSAYDGDAIVTERLKGQSCLTRNGAS